MKFSRSKSTVHTLSVLFLFFSLIAIISCDLPNPPELTSEDKKQDILFLYKWAKDYSPFVELNEKYKNSPSVDSLKNRYLELAVKANDNEEFFQVANGFFRLIGTSGHSYIPDDKTLNFYMNEFRISNPTNISIKQYKEAQYWNRLIKESTIFAHPPFRIKYKNTEYFLGNDWQYNETLIPQGSKISTINGLTCSSYLDFIKQNTWIRYIAYDKDWIDKHLLIIDEGIDIKGWNVEFLLPDSSTLKIFVPKVKGYPSANNNSRNCICVEIRNDVGYIRIRSFPYNLTETDRNQIKDFLEKSEGNYNKLIIDIRNHGGGTPEYFYKNLIIPFLDEPVTYQQITGIRKQFLDEMNPPHLKYLRKYVSTPIQGVVNVVETNPPTGFNPKEWKFLEITRTINPSNRYNFNGKLYILINGGSFSAADDYANAIKRIGLGTLVGENTGGGAAAYFGPVTVRLPRSGLIFVLEADLLLNPDGSFNELYGTEPDVKLSKIDFPVSFKKSELLKDEWIQKIITEL